MIAASLAFTVMVGLVKLAREELSALEIVAWRGFISAPFALWLAGRAVVRMRRWPVVALRGVLGFGAMACFFTAAKGLWLADLAVVTRLQPVLVAVIAPLALGSAERFGWRVVVAIALGLGGTVVLLQPELEVGSIYGLWALAGAALSAGAHLTVRSLGRDNRPEGVVFWFQLLSLALALAVLLLKNGSVALPPGRLIPHLVGIGAFATLGQVLMTHAYQQDSAPVVASASYVGPIWGIIADVVLFATLPSVNVLIGGGLVIGAGAVLLAQPRRVSSGAERVDAAAQPPR